MIEIGDRPEDTLIRFVRVWFKSLARGEWQAALAAIDEPNAYGIRWTKDEITEILHEAFGTGMLFDVEYGAPFFSDPDSATGKAQHSFGRIEAGGFWLDHSVPLLKKDRE
jgi:hypothetical protein